MLSVHKSPIEAVDMTSVQLYIGFLQTTGTMSCRDDQDYSGIMERRRTLSSNYEGKGFHIPVVIKGYS